MLLCLVLLILHSKFTFAQNDTFPALELTSMKTHATEADSITLTCTLTVAPNYSQPLSVSWNYISWDDQSELSSEDIISGDNSSESSTYSFVIDPSSPFKRSGNYSCFIKFENNETYQSDDITLYFRRFILRLPEGNVAYANEEIIIELFRYGDSSSVICDTGTVYDQVDLEYKYLSESSLKFSADESLTVTCVATFSDGLELSNSTEIEILVPEWSEWGNFSDTCETNVDMDNNCVRIRNRSCVNHNLYSTCKGERTNYGSCDPDECEPLITAWGLWDECKLKKDTGCMRSRYKTCIPATNSSNTCAGQVLKESEDCNDLDCDRWSAWGDWSTCREISGTCVKRRTRDCELDVECAGKYFEQDKCLVNSRCAPQFTNTYQTEIKRPYLQSFFLVCDIKPSENYGFSEMHIKWRRDNMTISSFTPIDVNNRRYNGPKLNEFNEGVYQCCVANKFGETCNSGWNILLSDYGPVPSDYSRTDINIVIDSNYNSTFDCPLDGYNLRYEWYRGGSIKIPDANTKQYTLYDMSKDQEGLYFCCADDTHFHKSECSEGFSVMLPENSQRKYVIVIVSLVVIFVICLLLFIVCVRYNTMSTFKRRFRHTFVRSQGKLYNDLEMYSDSQVIQRSHSYMKRLSKSRPLTKSELSDLLQTLLDQPDPNEYPDNFELGVEFESLPNNYITINKTPVGTESKNRYLNVLPNPHSRVSLKEENTDPTSCYINANYVRGYKLTHKDYIATQGPIPSTVYDFWRLVWEEKSQIIVMTTGLIENGRMKCSLYWPASLEDPIMRIGTFEIEQAGMFPSRHYTLNILKLRKKEEEDEEVEEEEEEEEARIIYHFWYHSWPDFGVPDDTGPFLDFVECVRSFRRSLEDTPTIAHCSAGIGRTGTFVAVNLGIEQLADMGKVDPLDYICQLRQDRGGMIQTIDQYMFVHRALHAYQCRVDTRIPEEKVYIQFGFHTLSEHNPLLPPGIRLPTVTNIEGSIVDDNFIKTLTQTLRSVSRYSDSITSVNNLSIRDSNESIDNSKEASKPLLHKKSSVPKHKRKSKVKSLFFPPATKDNVDTKRLSAGTAPDPSGLEQRSLSLNNVEFSQKRDKTLTSAKSSDVSINID